MADTAILGDDLLQRLVLDRPRRVWFLIVALLALDVAAVTADQFVSPGTTPWRRVPLPLSLILWLLLLHPWREAHFQAALDGLRRLKAKGDHSIDDALRAQTPPGTVRSLLPAFPGLVAGVVLTHPWQPDINTWAPSRIAAMVLLAIYFSMLGLTVDVTVRRTRLLAHLLHGEMEVTVFDMSAFQPVATNALTSTVTVLGWITLLAIFYPEPFTASIAGAVLFGLGVAATLTAFLLAVMRAHQIMRRARRTELTRIRAHLQKAYESLNSSATERHPVELGAEGSAVSAWLECERRVLAAPEWPFTGDTIRTLLVGLGAPVAVAIIQAYLGSHH